MDKRQILELFLIILIFYLLAWMFWLGPEWKAVKKIKTELHVIQEQQAVFIKKNIELKNIDAQFVEIQNKLKTIKKSMLNSSLSQILAFCEQTSQQAGLKLIAFQPGRESTHNFYSQKELSLNLTGSFQGHIDFLRQFNQVDSFLLLQEIHLQDTGTEVGLNMQVSFQTYNVLDQKAEEQ